MNAVSRTDRRIARLEVLVDQWRSWANDDAAAIAGMHPSEAQSKGWNFRRAWVVRRLGKATRELASLRAGAICPPSELVA